MSLEIIKKAVKDFVSNDSPEVLSIKGGWGVGKTYFWNNFIKTNRNELKSPFDKYAYISLFGISTLEELKFAIFERLVEKDQIEERFSIDILNKNITSVSSMLGKKAWPILSNIPFLQKYVPFAFLQSASFALINNSLICIDDFERKGDHLPAKDILGLVSLLKEQKHCKVVLIFNDSNFDDKSQKEYKQFREKVIDTEITYAPTALESASLVFKEENEIDKQLIGLTTKLNITNIRILRKIQNAAYSVTKSLEQIKPEPELFQQSLPTIVLLVWCYYSHDKNIPSYDYVKKSSFQISLLAIEGEEDKRSEEEKDWDAILRQYGYGETNEFDLALTTVIETGYISEQLLLEEAKKCNEQIIANKSKNFFIYRMAIIS